MRADINLLIKASFGLILKRLNAVDNEKNKDALAKICKIKKNITKNIYRQNQSISAS